MVAVLEAECSGRCGPNLFLTHLSQTPAVLTSSIGWREVVIFLFCFHSEELKIKRELNAPVSSGWTRPFWTGLLFEKDPAHVGHSMLSLGIKNKMSAILLITHSTLYSNLLSIQQSKCEQGI